MNADEQAVIDVLATYDHPVSMFDVAHAIAPRPAPRPGREHIDGRHREVKAWQVRTIELIHACVDLWERGVVVDVETPDAERPWGIILARVNEEASS